MKEQEIRKILEDRGYEVRSIRVFKKTFHVNYLTDEVKIRRWLKFPIEKLTIKDMRTW